MYDFYRIRNDGSQPTVKKRISRPFTPVEMVEQMTDSYKVSLLKTLAANVNNEKLSDAEFRELFRNCLKP